MGCVGSFFLVAFFKVRHQPQLYRMYAIHRQFNYDYVNTFSSKKKKARRKKQEEKSKKKKDNKKAS